ncbi:MAG: methyltransferase regulatory domain-containing protein, partial [Thermoguttaceae bacterium]
ENDSISTTESAYDEVLYDALPHTQGNIRLIETVADLFGVPTKDVNNARILEIGTATGKTIIPQAEELPNSQFLGIDLSDQQIKVGQQFIRTLGLKNIELRHANMMDVDASWGEFDYIISHGVYSWIPPFVQDKMLEICSQNLAPGGVAMISYNTYPGWHFKEYVRNIMLLHAVQANTFTDSDTKVQQARAIVNYIAQRANQKPDSYFAKFTEEMKQMIQGVDDYYLYHEYLEPENHPCYLLDFCRRLHDKRLKHVSDFEWTDFQIWLTDAELSRLIEKTHHTEISEQYMDFIINRTFRSSIICRSDVPTRIRSDIVNRYSFYVPTDCVIQEIDTDS